MSITELMEKAKISASKRTQEDRKALLEKAHILDSNGYYDAKYFSDKTVSKSKENRRTA
ncbi:MAG: hypothetical protein NT094_00165 [Candidatus Staskawiczbacteria bacterium]|nr:hypothetical protein [Candidatus Staskawiczbacteria bacterium]